jgi:hypothetical protein
VQEQFLVASRRKIAIQALTVSALLAASVFAVIWGDRASDTRVLTYGLFFAFILWFGLIAILVSFARPGRLVIGKEALTIKGSIRQRRIAWSDVQEFAVKAKSPLITIRYDPARPDGRRRAARGREQTFPVGDFSMSPPAIVQLLNQALREGVEITSPSIPEATHEQPQIVS